jgi:DNA topoisomerase-3
MKAETFMKEIRQLVQDIVDKTKSFDETKVGAVPFGVNDPFSGKPLFITLRDYRTEDGSFTVPKAIGGRIMAPEEVKELLDKRMIGPLDGFRSRIGRPFSAAVKLNDEHKVELVWDQEKLEDAAQIDFSKEEPVGVSPLNPQERVFETPSGFVGEFSIGKKGPEAFRIGKKILSKEIDRGQVKKLLAEGKTDLILGFVSTRTKRPFKAFLVLKEGGKLGFEFPPREPKAPKGKKGKAGKGKAGETEANGAAGE